MNSQEAKDAGYMQMSSVLLSKNWQFQLTVIQNTFSYYLLYLEILDKTLKSKRNSTRAVEL